MILPYNANLGRIDFSEGTGVFCASVADVFDNNKVLSAWREELFKLIRECDQLDWLLPTKRPQNILKMLPSDWGDGYLNVWLGMTAEDQMHFDQRWKLLQKIPALIKFVSYEPALGPLRLPALGPYPDWLISGGGKWRRGTPHKATVDSGCDCGLPGAWRCPVSQTMGRVPK